MAAANLTARSPNATGRARLDHINIPPQWSSSGETNYYQGGAIAKRLVAGAAANVGVGTADRNFDGTVQNMFAGVCIRNVTVPAQAGTGFANRPDENRYGVPVVTRGSFVFDQSDDETYDYDGESEIGRTVWFHSDHEVGLTPPASGAVYPIPAGVIRRIVTASDTNADAKLEVDITNHVGRQPRKEMFTIFVPSVALAKSGSADVLAAAAAGTADRFTLGERFWISRALISCATELLGAGGLTVDIAVSAGTAVSCTVPTTVGVTKETAINKEFTVTDVLAITLEEDGTEEVSAGALNITLEVFPLDQ